MHDAKLTAPQTILLAAHRLDSAGHRPMTIEALTVESWKLDKGRFGLKGFVDLYPNANVVYAALMGSRGMVHNGWLKHAGPKLYELSKQGRKEAERLTNGDSDRLGRLGYIQPAPAVEAELVRLLDTKVVLRLRSNMGQTLNRTDAEAFWHNTDPDGVDETIRAARECLVDGSVRLRSGREVRDTELAELNRAADWLGLCWWSKVEELRWA